MKESLSQRRLAENEVIFRQANERVEKGLKDLQAKAKAEGFDDLYDKDTEETPLHFYCECADEKCRQRIVLTPSEYKDLHHSSTTFVVRPGHQLPDIERVIRKEKGYVVVDKFMTPPKTATKLNPTDLDNTSE